MSKTLNRMTERHEQMTNGMHPHEHGKTKTPKPDEQASQQETTTDKGKPSEGKSTTK